jgi:cell division protein ZapA
MKQVEVTILGQSYLLACPDDGEEALLQAVATVDREMSAIRDAGKVKARERMAVLAALNLAYRLAERDISSAAQAGSGSLPGGQGAALGPTGAGAAGANDGDIGHIDLDGLIARLDEVLAEDGRLL